MSIGPEIRQYMGSTLRKAVSSYYGDRVPTLKEFINRRRKTYMDKLEQEVGAQGLRDGLAEARQVKGTKQGVLTKLDENFQVKQVEQRARFEQEIAELKAKHQREAAELVAKYEPDRMNARAELREAEEKLSELGRASYFAGLEAEDDGRQFYGAKTVDDAIKERVDAYIEQNLGNDEEGRAVEQRINEESMINDIVYIADNMKDLRLKILSFIAVGKLPPITIEAWLIENGKDLTPTS